MIHIYKAQRNGSDRWGATQHFVGREKRLWSCDKKDVIFGELFFASQTLAERTGIPIWHAYNAELGISMIVEGQ
jgi:hypothetical protein